MTEYCPLSERKFPTDTRGVIVGRNVPAECIKCLMRTLYGGNAEHRLAVLEKSTSSEVPEFGVRPLDELSEADRNGTITRKFTPDDTTLVVDFICERQNNPKLNMTEEERRVLWEQAIADEDFDLAKTLEP